MEQKQKIDKRKCRPITFRPGMKLDPTKAKRVEVKRYATDNRPYRTFIFDCYGGCGREIRCSHSGLYVATGLCSSCVAKKRPYEHVLGFLKATARHKGLDVTLTYEDFLEYVSEGRCHYCGSPIEWLKHAEGPNYQKSYFLDRKNNAIGYTKDNCVPCCTTCNFIRQDKLSYEEMLLLKDGLKQIAAKRKGEVSGVSEFQ